MPARAKKIKGSRQRLRPAATILARLTGVCRSEPCARRLSRDNGERHATDEKTEDLEDLRTSSLAERAAESANDLDVEAPVHRRIEGGAVVLHADVHPAPPLAAEGASGVDDAEFNRTPVALFKLGNSELGTVDKGVGVATDT